MSATKPHDPLEGLWQGARSFDDFVVVRPLGRGGMGQVFLGHDMVLDRPVALKFTAARDPSAAVRRRFLREARAIARLSHPNVVGIYRVGEVRARPYIAYEFVEGDGLDRLRAPMPWARVARIGLGLARGLAAAHRAGVLHRDIKPGNVMLASSGDVKLLDFGLARLRADEAHPDAASATPARFDAAAETLSAEVSQAGASAVTHAGAILGTPAYLPPEAWRHEPITERSDLFALGLVLYELLTGSLHHVEDRRVSVDVLLHDDAPPLLARCPDVLPSLAEIIHRCLQRDPAARPPSADLLADDFERVCTLFVPAAAAAAPLGDDRDAALVERTLARVMGRGDDFTRRVYEILFAAHPDLRPLFPRDLDGQRQKLLHAFQLTFGGMRDPARVTTLLRDLGRRHGHLGLRDGHYAALGGVVLAALRELDDGLDGETGDAWRRAWAFVTREMRHGERSSGDVSNARAASTTPAPPSSSDEGPAAPPTTRFAYVGDVGLAYQVLDATTRDRAPGPDVVVHLGRASHVDLVWQHPAPASWLRGLCAVGRVIVFDKRGAGRSERAVAAVGLQDRVEDLLAVLDAASSQRAVVVGVGEGASTALLAAALFPSRVRAVVSFHGTARVVTAPDYPGGLDPSFLEGALEEVRHAWGDAPFVDAEAPSRAGDDAFRAWFGDYLRASVSPGVAAAWLRFNTLVDLRWLLPRLRAPTLVLHRVDNRHVPIADARYLADALHGSRFVALPGADHPPYVGDGARVLEEITSFVSGLGVGDRPAPLETFALVRAAAADSPLLARAAERFTSLGARRIDLGDACVVCAATPWFGSATEALARLSSARAARAQGIRAALCVGPSTPDDEAHAARALAAVTADADAGSCVVWPELTKLCCGMKLRFDDAGVTVGGAPLSFVEPDDE